ncbi:MAG: hypothetical protein HQ510_07765 [Candidatus Marinimicrobia bacterium]|nr:hypothetical protein [Candidatus Neomarinimicrobiota bacterium]
MAIQPAGYGSFIKIWLHSEEIISDVQFTLSGMPDCLEYSGFQPESTQNWTIESIDSDNFPTYFTVHLSVENYEPPMNFTSRIGRILFSYDEYCGGSDMVLEDVTLVNDAGEEIPVVIYNNPFCNQIKGDLNGDYVIDVLDVVYMVSIIMETIEIIDTCTAWAADINDNWVIDDPPWFIWFPPILTIIDVLDIVYLINIILGP